MSNINSLSEQAPNGKATATTFSEQLDTGSNDDDSRGIRRSRRTPKKYGNFYSVGNEADEEFEDDLADDSDEDPSWDDKKGEEFSPKPTDVDSDQERKKKMKKMQGSPPGTVPKGQKQAPRQFAHPQMAIQAPQVWFTHEELARRAYQLAQQSPKLMNSGLPAAINTINPQLLSPQQQQHLQAIKMQQAHQQAQQAHQQQVHQQQVHQQQVHHHQQQQHRMNPGVFSPMSMSSQPSNNASISSLVHSAPPQTQPTDPTSIHGLNNPLQPSNSLQGLPKMAPPANLLTQLTPLQKQHLLLQHQLQQKLQSGSGGVPNNPNSPFGQQNMISQQLALQRLAQLQQAAQQLKQPVPQTPFGNPSNASINSILNPNTSNSMSELPPPRDPVIKLSDLPDLTVVTDFPGNGNIPPPKLATTPQPSSSVKSISDLINQPTTSHQPSSFGSVNSMTSNSAVPMRNILNPATPIMRSPYQNAPQMPQGLPFMSPFRQMDRPGEAAPNWMFQNIQMNQPSKPMVMQQRPPMNVVRPPQQPIQHRPPPKRPPKKKKSGQDSEESEFSSSEESEIEQYGTEDDPQVKTLMNIMKQCEQYSNQIREILKQWQVQEQAQAQPQNPFAANFQNTYPFQIQPPAPQPPPQTPHLELIKQPELLKCELRNYQLVGLNWLYLVFQQKINAILADEMGLGKTIQTIAIFALLKQRGETKKPHLVIAPATALENWVRELNTWCPDLSVFMYHGSAKDREVLRKKLVSKDGQPIAEFDVLITTYNLCINKTDRVKLFKKFQFCYIVLDEAHNIKNVSSARYQSLFKLAFRAEHRLMLTGTPLQNNVNELWALLSFLMPNIFSATKDFKSLVWPEENPDEKDKGAPKPGQLAPDYSEQVRRLKTILSPFLLRRLKSEVLGKLPPKTEKIRWCDLTEFQKNIYLRTYQMSRTKYHQVIEQKVPEDTEIKKENLEIKKEGEDEDKDVNDKEENINENETEGSLNHILMQLRKAANNSLLFRNLYSDNDILEIEAIMKEAEVKEEEILQKQKAAEAAALKAKEEAAAQAAQAAEEMKIDVPAEQPQDEDKEAMEESHVPSPSPKAKQEAPTKRQTRGRAPVVEEIVPEEPPEDEDCALCGEPGNLLYCDGPCNRAFHLPCVNLTEVPEADKWFCSDCTKANGDGTKNEQKETDKKAADLDNWDDVKTHMNEICKLIETSADPKGRLRAELFIELPDKEDYPDYYKLIKKPVCLNDIKDRVQNTYTTVEAFRDDFLQMFTNAKTYNVAKSQIYRDAQFMEKQMREAMASSFPSITLPPEKVDKPEKPEKLRVSPKSPPVTRKRKTAPKESPATDDSLSFDEFSDEDLSDDDGPPRKGKRGNTVGRNTRNSRSSAFAVDLGIRRSSRNKRYRHASADDDDYESMNVENSNHEDQEDNNNNASPKPKRQPKGRKPKLEEPFLTCRDVIEDLMEQDLSAPFNEPVDPVKLNLPNYFKIVKQPMDLGTILKKLNNNEYPNTDLFVGEVRLVFDNCLKFNEAQSDIGMAAQTLWRYFKTQCKKNNIEVKEVSKRNSKKGYKVAEELRAMSDFQIHSYCKQHQKYLSNFLIPDEKFFTSSGKIVSLKKKLESLKRKDSRVIIFSQFTAVLDILEDLMSRVGYRYLRLDGQTPVLDRQQLIDEYNTNREIFVFLLSTRAGGIGINLTSANICIFHDIDWNPEMDRQAEARIHRIGQTKPVTIIKLLSKDSVDEYIQKMADSKKERNDLVMGEAKPGLVSDAEAKFSIGKVLASIFGSK